MLQLERFEAAGEHFAAVEELYLEVPGVIGVALTEAPDWVARNPGGPQFAIYVEDSTQVDAGRADGSLPETIVTSMDEVEVAIVPARIEMDGHSQDSSPLRPGDSTSGVRQIWGTLGAVVQSPGSGDHFLTCGHVLDGAGTAVHQSGLAHAIQAGRNDRQVGSTVQNSFVQGTFDAALAKIDSTFALNAVPYDSPAPSAATPAAGLYRGRFRPVGQPTRPFYAHIKGALDSVGASMSHITEVTEKDKGRKVYASGSTSCEMISVVDGPATFNDGGVRTAGFVTDRETGGTSGDSGAVCVISRDGKTILRKEDGGLVDVTASDMDGALDYVPGTLPELDGLLAGDGRNIKVNGTELDSGTGGNLLARIAARLRKLGELDVTVLAHGYRNPCLAEGRKAKRPTPCREIILKPDQPVDQPELEFDENDEIESETDCCTFGLKPFVVISGDDSERTEFNLAVTGTASIRVVYEISQTVMSARFLRHGSCYRNICDPEVLRGTVVLSRTTNIELIGSLGEIELPIIGPIKAGDGSFKRKVTKTVKKRFVIPCEGT